VTNLGFNHHKVVCDRSMTGITDVWDVWKGFMIWLKGHHVPEQKWETTRQLGCIHTGSNWEMGLTLWWTSLEINLWHFGIKYVEDPAARCDWRCGLVVGLIHLVSQFASKKIMLTGLFSRVKNVKFHPPKMLLIVFDWTYNDAFPKSNANMILKIITNTWIKDSFQTHFSNFKILFRND